MKLDHGGSRVGRTYDFDIIDWYWLTGGLDIVFVIDFNKLYCNRLQIFVNRQNEFLGKKAIT